MYRMQSGRAALDLNTKASCKSWGIQCDIVSMHLICHRMFLPHLPFHGMFASDSRGFRIQRTSHILRSHFDSSHSSFHRTRSAISVSSEGICYASGTRRNTNCTNMGCILCTATIFLSCAHPSNTESAKLTPLQC